MAGRLVAAFALAALAILWLGECTGIDMSLARAAYDPLRGEFPWRHAFLTEAVGHRYLRHVCLLAGAGVIGAVLLDLRCRVFSEGTRRRMRLLACNAVLVPLAVSLAKRSSALSCPWDLQVFHGKQPYFRLLDAVPVEAVAGHCWPAGHASGMLWLLGLVVFWLPHRPCRAAVAGTVVMAAGLATGWVQQLRGAHFLSHTLWSMWMAGAITAALWYWMLYRPPPRGR